MTPALEGKIEEAKKKITDFKARAAFEYVKLKQFIKRYMGNSTTFFKMLYEWHVYLRKFHPDYEIWRAENNF